jgi:hypothetical protein
MRMRYRWYAIMLTHRQREATKEEKMDQYVAQAVGLKVTSRGGGAQLKVIPRWNTAQKNDFEEKAGTGGKEWKGEWGERHWRLT